MSVLPSTTCELSDRPLKAATVRVVRLLAAAIDHRVSPGWTVCGTVAEAVAGSARVAAKRTADRRVVRKRGLRAPGGRIRALPATPRFPSGARVVTTPCNRPGRM